MLKWRIVEVFLYVCVLVHVIECQCKTYLKTGTTLISTDTTATMTTLSSTTTITAIPTIASTTTTSTTFTTSTITTTITTTSTTTTVTTTTKLTVLTHYWQFNDLNAMNKDNIGGADLYNPINSTLVVDRFGNAMSAIHFESGYYVVPTGIVFSAEFAITGWVRPTSISGNFWARFIDFISLDQTSYYINFIFSVSTSLKPLFLVQANRSREEILSNTALSLNSWNHIAAVKTLDALKLYINGTLVSQKASNIKQFNLTQYVAYIGKTASIGDTGSLRAVADMDDIKIFNGSLTNDQVLNDYMD